MKGHSSARNVFTYQVAWTTTRARRFFRSLKNRKEIILLFYLLLEEQVGLRSML